MGDMLLGKVTLVTGGGSGIGRATAALMAKEGAQVAVADIDGIRAKETSDMIAEVGGSSLGFKCDISKRIEVDALIHEVVGRFGRLDCACNNAGISPSQAGGAGRRTADWPEEAFDRVISVNLKGVWLCMRAELLQMTKQGSGAIVNVASVAGLAGLQMSSGYVASKHGVVGLTRSAGIEYASENIRVNAVAPGFIATDMTKEVMARRGIEVLALIPQGRLGVVDNIAEMICWLSSDRAAYVNGVTYNVDGGYLAS